MKLLVQLINDVMQDAFNDAEKRQAFDDAVKAMNAYQEITNFLKKYYPDNEIIIPTEVYKK